MSISLRCRCRFNVQIKDLVSKLPGVTSKNIFAILNKTDNLAELLELGEERLAELLGSAQHGSQLHAALHGTITIPDPEEAKAAKKKPFKRFKSKK